MHNGSDNIAIETVDDIGKDLRSHTRGVQYVMKTYS